MEGCPIIGFPANTYRHTLHTLQIRPYKSECRVGFIWTGIDIIRLDKAMILCEQGKDVA